MQQLVRLDLDGVRATIAHSTRADGDLSPATVESELLTARRRAAIDAPWRVLRQVHSDRVIVANRTSDERPVGDALVTGQPNLALAVHAGDCVPVGFVHPAGLVAAAHAGWKGLEAGVLESTVRSLQELAPRAAPIIAAVGPHIRAAHYEFGPSDLARLAARFGPAVVASTSDGKPALDLTAAIASELRRLGVTVETWSPHCTAQDKANYWSHRARQEPGRIALVAWMEEST